MLENSCILSYSQHTYINEMIYYLGSYLYLILSKFNLVNHALDRGQIGDMLDVCVYICLFVFLALQPIVVVFSQLGSVL